MSAKKETFYVAQSGHGWIVKRTGGEPCSGPFPAKEHAIAKALIFAKEFKPSAIKLKNLFGECQVECTYQEQTVPTAD